MRRTLHIIAISTTLWATGARAQCEDQAGQGDCRPTTTVSVAPLPSITAAPVLDIDAVVQANGAVFVHNPNAHVLVTVRGTGPDGGGLLPLQDGGVDSTHAGEPLLSSLALSGFKVDRGVFTVTFDGGTALFLGDNTITVSAVRPSGMRFESTPQMVKLDPSVDGGGVLPDGGVVGGGPLPDGGFAAGAGLSLASGDVAQGCSTTGSGSPSFFLMALGVMAVALGRRGMRS